MSRDYPKRTFDRVVGSTDVSITLDCADLVIAVDLLTEQNRTAALIGTTADLIAEWQYACGMADADYRNWYGRAAEGVVQAALDANEKPPAEHRIKFMVEGSDAFLDKKELVERLYSEWNWLKGYHQALLAKVDLIKARTSMEVGDRRAVAHGLGDPLPSFHDGEGAQPAAMRELEQPRERSRDAFKRRREHQDV